MNNSKKDDLDTKIALFRYELIIPVLNRTYPDRSALQYFKRIASAPLKYPDGTSKEYSFQTIRYWYDVNSKIKITKKVGIIITSFGNEKLS